ncbi:MAG TPA: rhamnogalacturonan acetylesterase, partial [Lacibacter sp.]|nr:rhamnogalacturonan acetylesterase [Lacibacter sp.]
FRSEGLWQSILDAAGPGDYVFIQFGHNDESVEKQERYAPPDTFRLNLQRFVQEAKMKKAIPVLLTPVSRRRFDAGGNALETHIPYSRMVREVATEEQVYLLDLDTRSRELFQRLGAETSRLLFLHLQPGEHPNYPDGKTDNTHFNELGARLIAQLVLQEMQRLQVPLLKHLVKRLT